MVEMQSLPLEGVLGRELGAFYRDVHAEHGVELHLGSGVEASRAPAAPSACAPATAPSSSAPRCCSASASLRAPRWRRAC